MQHPRAHRRTSRTSAHGARRLSPRPAFTLIEMLVATALVVLMMLLFSQIFSKAIETMRNQRSLASNDQKARVVSSTLRGDLWRMTYRQPLSGDVRGIVPLVFGDTVDPRQRGFFYLSENDPFDDTDDVLHFTVDLAELLRTPPGADASASPFFGRGRTVAGAGNRNQPDWDDGEWGNSAASSRAAEIVYFLRGGNLYRRVLLIRDPLPSATPPFSTQPRQGPSGTGAPFAAFENAYPPETTFYNDFDFSGTRVQVSGVPSNPMPEGTDDYRFHFHGLDSLTNNLGLVNLPLARPQNRFGFHPSDGRPREFLLGPPPGNARVAYIGRFTHEETSFDEDANDNGMLDPGEDLNGNNAIDGFVWPGSEPGPVLAAGSGNPMTNRSLQLNAAGVVTFNGAAMSGPRVAEDLLVPGVEAFDVEVWDPGYQEPFDNNNNNQFDPFFPQEDLNGNGVRDIGAWVQLGNNFGPGVYALSRRTNRGYGPFVNDNAGPAAPMPASAGLNRVYDTWHPAAGRDYDGDGTIQTDERLPPYRPVLRTSSDVMAAGMAGPTWSTPGTPSMGHVYFPDPNGSIGFRAIAVGGPTGPTQPEWPRVPGTIVQDGGVTWQAFDNRIGLEKIRITIRFRDPNTDHPRQVTVIHSFVE